jgi:predicted ATPase
MAVAVLHMLIERGGDLVTKEELLKHVWAGTYVTNTVLRVCISEIRRALADDAATPRYIQTVGREGYRFVNQTKKGELVSVPEEEETRDEFIVGREREVKQLQRWLTSADRGTRQIVFVTGEPGIGKTTVVEQFLAQIPAGRGVKIGRGQCLEQYGEGEAYLPVLEALVRLCRDSGGTHVATILNRYAPTWLVQMPSVVPQAELAALQQRVQGTTHQRMLREMSEAIEALTASTPLVLFLEDLHWSDYSTLELISYLASQKERARLMVIGTYRPADIIGSHPLKGIKEELYVRGRCHELAVPLLTERDVVAFVSHCFSQNPTVVKLASVIHRRTEGNALFMVNVVNAVASQKMEQTNRHQEPQGSITDFDVPVSLRQVIEQRLEKFTIEERHLFEAASVAGTEFAAAAVAVGVGREALQVEEICAEFARRQLFIQERETADWPDGTVTARYGFIHTLYHEVLYGRVTAGRRVALHQRIGERLEQGYGPRTSEIAAELALHFEQGRDYRRAIEYLKQEAEKGRQRFAYREAANHLTKALALLKTQLDTPERLQQELFLRATLGPTLAAIKGLADPEVGEIYTRARELCRQVGESSQLFPILRGLTTFYSVRAEHQITRELAEQCLSLAQGAQDPIQLLGAHLEVGSAFFYLGDLAQAREHLEQGMALYDPRQHDAYIRLYGYDLGVSCFARAASVLWLMGYPEQALDKVRGALTLAQKHAHPFSMAYALCFSAECHRLRREERITQERADAAIRLSAEQGFPLWMAGATIYKGWALAEQGQYKEGISLMREGMGSWLATGAEVARSSWLAQLAEGCGKAGQVAEGLSAVTEGLAVTNAREERWWEAELYRLKGEMSLRLGEVKANLGKSRRGKPSQGKSRVPDSQHLASSLPTAEAEAEGCFQKALEIARKQQAKSLELRAAMSLMRLWRSQGKSSEAQHLLLSIYSWFTEGFDTPDLRDAKALLDQS